jgi:hypothetical protein
VLFAKPSVIEAVSRDYVAAWESVAPLNVDDFDLGDGTTIRAAWGGNIAMYMCTPEGKVLDVLPGLHDPTTVVRELGAAKKLVALPAEGLRELHGRLAGDLVLAAGAIVERPRLAEIARKSVVFAPAEPRKRVDIIVPGGYEHYKRRAHALLAERALATPGEMTREVYEVVLGEPLGPRPKPDIRAEPTSLMLVE